MEGHPQELLARLCTRGASGAWTEFLEEYSPLLLQVVKRFERDPDRVADCFLFVCERLSRRAYRRLRRYRPDGPARFKTWLRAVTFNLCLDWHRREFGRQRPFRAITHLGALEQEVFRCFYLRGLGREATLHALRPRFPTLTYEEVLGCEGTLRHVLSARQLWLLEVRQPKHLSLEGPSDASDGPGPVEIADPGPGPDGILGLNEQRATLSAALSKLPEADRLLVRMRYQEGLTLAEIGRVTGLGGPQKVDRRLHEIVGRLREEFA